MCLRYWQNRIKIQLEQLHHGSQKEFHPNQNLLRFNSQEEFYDIAKSSTDT